jgi:hypothetical protein
VTGRSVRGRLYDADFALSGSELTESTLVGRAVFIGFKRDGFTFIRKYL